MNYKELIVKESVLLASFPVLGYVIAIAFEYGYAAYFGYPLSLIVVDLRMTLTSAVLGAGYGCVLFVVYDLLAISAKRSNYFGRFLRPLLPYYLFSLFVIFMSGFVVLVYKQVFAFAVAVTVYATGQMIWHIKTYGLNEGFDKYQLHMTPLMRKDGEGAVVRLVLKYSLAALLAIGMVFGAGRLYAQVKQQWSYFDMDGQKYIVAAVYGDSVVGVKTSSGELLGEFSVVAKDDSVMKKLGVLLLSQEKPGFEEKSLSEK